MGQWLLAWIGVPVLVLGLVLGLGLLLQRLLAVGLAAVQLVGLGFAALVVVTTLLVEFPAIAPMAASLTVVAALIGWAVGGVRLLERRHRWWSVAALGAVYCVYASPAALAGVTWTGFISLDDTATWLAFADRLVTAGHTTDGLARSTFGRLIDVNWTGGYPVGAFGQLGVVAGLLRLDAAWVIHPLMATIAAVLAAALYALTARVIASPLLRAVVASVAASSALLFGYVLWGGLKEITMAALLAVSASFVARRETRRPWVDCVILAVPLAAVYVVFGLAGMVYIAPIALAQCAVLWRRHGYRATIIAGAAFVAVLLVLSLPALRMLPTQVAQLPTASLMDDQDIGNLYGPLNVWQVVGVWPVGDFRLAPSMPALAAFLIMVTVALAALGAVAAWRARAIAPLAYIGTSLLVAGYSVFGNAWLEGKALAVSSPAVLLAAGVGAAWLIERRRPFEGAALGALVLLGVAASVVLGYGSAWVAPPARMHELARIGQSNLPAPALMTEYSPLGARWFLRKLDAEGAGELRWNLIPMYSGAGLQKGAHADIDEFPLASLAPYPTLVLRTDVYGSRPPSTYRLASAGESYNVWVADPSAAAVIGHFPLGSQADPAAPAPCETVTTAATAAGPTGRLATVRRAPVLTIDLAAGGLPRGWTPGATPGSVAAETPGSVNVSVWVPADGEYRATLGGSVFGPVTVSVDGVEWATIDTSLNWSGTGTPLPPLPLTAGDHTVTVQYRPGWGPGQARSPVTFGPLVLSTQGPESPVEYVPVARASSLCGQRLDWIEAVR